MTSKNKYKSQGKIATFSIEYKIVSDNVPRTDDMTKIFYLMNFSIETDI